MDNFGRSMEVQTLLNDISNELTKKFRELKCNNGY